MMLRQLGTSLVGLMVASLPLTLSAHEVSQRISPKVMVITMFAGEAKPWLDNERFTQKVVVPGLSKAFPEVSCTDAGLCIVTTSMGYANAASSVSALVYSGRFDLSQTYFLIAGIAGVDPADGTLGSAHWARFAIDGGLQNTIDARDMPSDWTTGYVAIGASRPGEKVELKYGSEIYRLHEDLLQKAYSLTKDMELADGDTAKAYRSRYAAAPANAAPRVSICDTISMDTWWHGSRLGTAMEAWAKLITNGEANYCTTQQEDNATLTSLRRGADANLLDFDRIAILRAASNFDREGSGQTPVESLTAKSGGYIPSVTNAYRVGAKFAHAVVADWQNWSVGVPK
jgi:purine nucleoside permease